MNAQWFNALFYRDYDSVMNHVINYVNYDSGDSNDSGIGYEYK
jgi:hypothetical protein